LRGLALCSIVRWILVLGLALAGLASPTAAPTVAPATVASLVAGTAVAAQGSPAPQATQVWRYFLPSVSEPISDSVSYAESLLPNTYLPSLSGPGTPTAAPVKPSLELSAAKPTPVPSLIAMQSAEAEGTCPGYVGREGDQLVLGGQPFTFVGTNVSYLMHDYFPEAEVEVVLRYLSQAGATVLRVWVFPGHDLDRAERLFDLGRDYDLRFVVTLVNYYFDKGGWWFDPLHYSKEYLPHVQKTVARFRDRPEIIMWELMNEPNCSGGDENCPGNMLRWAEAVSKEIKALSPCHLVTTGTIRIDVGGEAYYSSLHALPAIDVVSIHRAADLWLEDEIRVARELDKPVLVGEIYAVAQDGGCKPLYDGVREDRAKLIAEDLDRTWAEGVDGYLLWEYGHGTVVNGEQIQYYCGGMDYLQDDPVWPLLQAAPVTRAPFAAPGRP